jgi:hypothetical protein
MHRIVPHGADGIYEHTFHSVPKVCQLRDFDGQALPYPVSSSARS